MKNEFTARLVRDGGWWVALCDEVPEANGQGTTRTEALDSLSSAIRLVLEERRQEAEAEARPSSEKVLVALD
ncbi:MAG TPA: type II toxin-antitoxin system HicB family antitoxin [Verrucomicrobiota bacterium]|nr:type II toxin-antitoxin system HicB family antitoxin [Verrucomicrobiota bacterium]